MLPARQGGAVLVRASPPCPRGLRPEQAAFAFSARERGLARSGGALPSAISWRAEGIESEDDGTPNAVDSRPSEGTSE